MPQDRLDLGTACYLEYDPEPNLDRDLDLMRDAGITVIRVGESTWAKWEPEDGRFELDWLQPVLDGAAARGIDVILGTPTYAVPPWLARRYPEIAAEKKDGSRHGWGGRQEIDLTHAAFRFHAERVIRAIVGRYARHPAVIGFQVDNEPGLHLLYNRGVFEAFVDDLRHQYGTVEELNRQWGLVYWSHELSTWADLWQPLGNAQPQYDLAWRRFQARIVAEFIGWQSEIVREFARPEQFVTTCMAYDRQALDDRLVAERLDVAAGNAYYTMGDGLAAAQPPALPQGWQTTGPWALLRSADRMWSSKQDGFLVTETNAGAIGGPADNQPGYDQQWRLAAWAMISRGARLVEYWQWSTLRFGTETFWVGVLPHDKQPGRVYQQIAALGQELRRLEPEVAGLRPLADVTLLYSTDSEYALAAQPFVAGEQGPRSHVNLLDAINEGLVAAGAAVGYVHVEQLTGLAPAEAVEQHPVLIAAGLYAASDAVLDWLEAYAVAGGHLVVGPRTAYADHEARARVEPKPARLAAAAGVSYQEFANLPDPVPVRDTYGQPAGKATLWAEYLVPDDATTLLRYDHPHLGQWAAATTRVHRAGRVTVVGTIPDRDTIRDLARRLVPHPVSGFAGLPAAVTASPALLRDGRQLAVLQHWGWGEAEVVLPREAVDLADGAVLGAGTVVTLGAWDTRLLVLPT